MTVFHSVPHLKVERPEKWTLELTSMIGRLCKDRFVPRNDALISFMRFS
jgi:hypothetical protein